MSGPSTAISQTVAIARLSCEHYEVPLGIDVRHSRPRLSWRFADTAARDWQQASYTLQITFTDSPPEEHTVTSSQSLLVPWPSRPFRSREAAQVRVKADGQDGSSTGWSTALHIEAAIFEPHDWKAVVISGEPQDADAPKRPQYFQAAFAAGSHVRAARIYASALGCYELYLNGHKVSKDLLSPGWQSYNHRQHFQVHDITNHLKQGSNVIGIIVGEGWYATRLNFGGGRRNIYGADLGAMLQVELDGQMVLATEEGTSWKWSYGPILSSEIYDGEVFDSRLNENLWAQTAEAAGSEEGKIWQRNVRSLGLPKGRLIAAEGPPVRVTQTLSAKALLNSDSGHKILDFGANIVGRLRIKKTPPLQAGESIRLRHAEVLEDRELGTRPLRLAKARVEIIGGGNFSEYTPTFTFHGFRYVQVDGWENLDIDCVVAEVLHTDMERIGWFECSHPLINQLHDNVLRSLRGNFVSVPTDCPQRDERLGWTGDLQVFATTAGFLYDTTAALSSWLEDLAEEQLNDYDSVVPLVVPNTLSDMFGPPPPSAIWGDAAVLTPYDLFTSSGDRAILIRQYQSMKAWLDNGIVRAPSGLWSETLMQFGDWLDPKAPPDAPWEGPTNNILAANAWLIHTTNVMSEICTVLGKKEESEHYRTMHEKLRNAFQLEYVTSAGRIMSDSQGALAMALAFDLMPRQHVETARDRLAVLVRKAIFKVSTGFAATPLILHVLSDNDLLALAYRMLQEGECPSWLYPVKMGATTIWERWDSMLPDGSINPGEMTSFNHYALGSVAAWLHKVIGGLSPTEPGWKSALVKPRPGGTVTRASASHLSPYGRIRCDWHIADARLRVAVQVPPNCTAVVDLGTQGGIHQVGSGLYDYDVPWSADPEWPPRAVQMPFGPPKLDVAL